MHVVRKILWAILLGLAVVWIFKYMKLIENFETSANNQEKLLEETITTYMTKISEILCPIIKDTLEKLQSDLMTEDEQRQGLDKLPEKRKQEIQDGALHQMKMASMGMSPDKLLVDKNLKGLLFPCPPPSNVNEIPLNIKEIILGTSTVCAPVALEIKNNLQSSRSCPPGTKASNESFEANIPVYITHTTKEAYEDITNTEAELLKKNRIIVLQAKLNGIKEALAHPLFIGLSADYKEIKDIKAQAEAGTLTPNCVA